MLMSSPSQVKSFNSNGYSNPSQSQPYNQRNNNTLNLDKNFNNISSKGNLLHGEVEKSINTNIRYLNLNNSAHTNPITSGSLQAAQYNARTFQQNNPNYNNNINNFINNNNNNYFNNNNNNNQNQQSSTNNSLNVSSNLILQKIREKFAQRGTTGILSIGRSFRINDIDNSRSISFTEFTNLCTRYGLGLSSNEIGSAFALFDKKRNGTINYEEFLSALRGGLNPFRRSLVDQAFTIIDKNKNGCIDYNDIISAFDATKHPAVVKGERTAESVYNEFFASFSMNRAIFAARKNNFHISREEWAEYYENVSMSIDDDAYFELMMNNCWRMNSSLGLNSNLKGLRIKGESAEGAASATALQDNYNKRYINSNDYDDINNNAFVLGQKRLASDNVTDMSSVGENNNGIIINKNNNNDNNNNFNLNYNNKFYYNSNNENLNNTQSPNNINNTNINNSKSVNAAAPAMASQQNQVLQIKRNNIINGNLGGGTPVTSNLALEKGKVILEKFRTKLFTRNSCNSLISLIRQFKLIDYKNTKKCNFEEFVNICKEFRIELSHSETLAIFSLFDPNRKNSFEYEEFLKAIKSEMSEKRKALVCLAFAVLDAKNASGLIELQELSSKYNMRRNPDVLSGRKSEQEVYGDFLQSLEFHFNIYKGNMDRKITLEEFIEYYSHVSCSIYSDEYFETMIRNCWNIVDRGDYYANKMATPVNGYNFNNNAGRVQSNFENGNLLVGYNPNLNGDANNNNYSGNANNTYSNNNNNNYGNYLPNKPYMNMNNINNNNLHNNSQQNQIYMKQSSLLAASAANNNPADEQLIKQVRDKILSRGIKGIFGIQRSFKIADHNKSGLIENEELLKLLKNYRFDITDIEFRKLFDILDSDRSGKVDFNEFLYGIVGEMNEFRKSLVTKAFMILDKTGNGRVDIDDLRGSFSAKMHPDVKSGKRTEEEVLSDFLDNFEIHFSLIVKKYNKFFLYTKTKVLAIDL